MSLDHIAQDYVAMVKEGQFMELLGKLYHEDAVSVEAVPGPDGGRVTQGLDALRAKSQSFESQHKINGQQFHALWPHGEDKFAVHMSFDMTHLASGHRWTTDEIIVLTVKGEKIIKEEFFYQRS